MSSGAEALKDVQSRAPENFRTPRYAERNPVWTADNSPTPAFYSKYLAKLDDWCEKRAKKDKNWESVINRQNWGGYIMRDVLALMKIRPLNMTLKAFIALLFSKNLHIMVRDGPGKRTLTAVFERKSSEYTFQARKRMNRHGSELTNAVVDCWECCFLADESKRKASTVNTSNFRKHCLNHVGVQKGCGYCQTPYSGSMPQTNHSSKCKDPRGKRRLQLDVWEFSGSLTFEATHPNRKQQIHDLYKIAKACDKAVSMELPRREANWGAK